MSSLSKLTLMTTIFIMFVFLISPMHLTSFLTETNHDTESEDMDHISEEIAQLEKELQDEQEALAVKEENARLNSREIAMADIDHNAAQEPKHIATNVNEHPDQHVAITNTSAAAEQTKDMIHINDPGVYMMVFRVADDGSSKQLEFRKMDNSSNIAQAETQPPHNGIDAVHHNNMTVHDQEPAYVSHNITPLEHHDNMVIAESSEPVFQEYRSSRWGADNIRLYVSHIEGKGIGYNEGYTSLGIALFPPFFCSCSFQPFLDLRGHVFDDGRFAANAGGGFRYAYSPLSAVLGLNVYYDYRQMRRGNFNQIGVGFEYLSNCLDLRVNGYIPIGNQFADVRTRHFDDFIGDFHATCRNEAVSTGGFDMEVGTWLNKWLPCNWCIPCIYVAAGPYYYTPKCGCSYTGGQFRAEMTFCSAWTVDLLTSYDRHNHGIVQGRIAYSIPLDRLFCGSSCDSCSWCDCLMRQPVQRHEIIATQRTCDWTWNWDSPPARSGCK